MPAGDAKPVHPQNPRALLKHVKTVIAVFLLDRHPANHPNDPPATLARTTVKDCPILLAEPRKCQQLLICSDVSTYTLLGSAQLSKVAPPAILCARSPTGHGGRSSLDPPPQTLRWFAPGRGQGWRLWRHQLQPLQPLKLSSKDWKCRKCN